ncbi:MAG: CHASE2 domain-containing protein [Spirochaetales bacterium]|nr:CHASE2 domain-containing protein [Spirochaetales bacterium]
MVWINRIPPFIRVIALLILSLIICSGIISSSLFKDIDNIFYDFWFTFRDLGRKERLLNSNISIEVTDNTICDDIIILGIDEESVNRFQAYPWSRMKYVDFFEYLNKAAPEKRPDFIFLDILFLDKSRKKIEEEFYLKNLEKDDLGILHSPEYRKFSEIIQKYQVDKPLGRVIDECGRVFLPFNLLEKQDTPGLEYYEAELALLKSFSIIAEKNKHLPVYKGIMPPIIEISAHARGIGSVTIEESGVKSLRKIPLFARLEEPGDKEIPENNLSRYYPSVDLLIALEFYDVPLENIIIKWGHHIVLKNARDPVSGKRGDVLIPVDMQGNLRINYRAPHRAFTVRSFSDVRNGRIPLDYFKGKYVLVGIMTPGASHDFWISPIGGMYGIEHHANILNTLFMRDFLHTFPEPVIPVFIILFACIAGLITYRQKFLLSSIIIMATLIGLFIISIVSFYYNFVFPYASILLVILITFIIILIYKGFTGELAILGLSRDIQQQILHNRELKEDLTKLVESTINATIEQVSDIDGYTGLHNEVLGILGNEFHTLKKHIYFNGAEAEILRLARLHDIGKININPNILRKSNRLSGPEYEEIKWHTIAGGRYLERFKEPAFQDAARIALGHQESWDGVNGYPKGIPNALGNTEIRNGRKIRWNLILDFMAVMDTFHAMASNRPYRKGLDIEIVFRELLYNANTQFGTRALEEFFSFFYILYKKGLVKIIGKTDIDFSQEKKNIFVNSANPGKIDDVLVRHIKMMELFNRTKKDIRSPDTACCFDVLQSMLTEYILIDSRHPEIKRMKNQLFLILLEKQKIKRIMTTYQDPESRMKLVEKLDNLNETQEFLKEKLFMKMKYKQLFVRKIMIEYYDIVNACPLEDLQSVCNEQSYAHSLVRKLKYWQNSSIDTMKFLERLIEDTKGVHRYNNLCRFLDSIGTSSSTACYMGNIFLTLYHYFLEEEREEYFTKIESLRLYINKIRLPDSSRIIHSFISFLDEALLKKINEQNDSLLKQWRNLFDIIEIYRDNSLLPLPADMKKILDQKTRPVPGYNIFTLLMELLGAYYTENHIVLKGNWVSIFRIMDQLNKLKGNVYSHIRNVIEKKDSGFLSQISSESAPFFNDSFPGNASHSDYLTYLLQVEKEYLLQHIDMPFLEMIIQFLDLAIWKKVCEIEEAYIILKNIERKDYIADFQGSTIRMIRNETDELNQGVDIFWQAMDWVEETLKII